MGEVMVVGSLNADLVAYAERLPGDGETVHGTTFARQAGGKGLNQAVASARAGASTSMVGCVGQDDLGTFLLDAARGGGVDVQGVDPVDGPSGVALISVDASATNRIIVVAGANDRLDETRVTARLVGRTPAVVLCQLETPLSGVAAALRHGRAGGAVTVLNPAPAAGLPDAVLADVDWLIPNEHEASLVLGVPVQVNDTETALSVARRLQTRGPRGVVITLGARGAIAVEADGTEHVLDPFPVTPVDTTAAGDAFCGAFAAGLAAALPPRSPCGGPAPPAPWPPPRPGAVPSIPTAAEIDRLIG